MPNLYAIRRGAGAEAEFACQAEPDAPVTWTEDLYGDHGIKHEAIILSDQSLAFALAAHLGGADVIEFTREEVYGS